MKERDGRKKKEKREVKGGGGWGVEMEAKEVSCVGKLQKVLW